MLVADGPRATGGLSICEPALELNPDLAVAHNRLGVWLAGRGQLTDAEQHFVAATRLLPNKANAHNNLGLAIARQGRYREALDHYQRALALDPRDSSTHYNLGTVARTTRPTQQSAIALQGGSQERSPNTTRPLNQIAGFKPPRAGTPEVGRSFYSTSRFFGGGSAEIFAEECCTE